MDGHGNDLKAEIEELRRRAESVFRGRRSAGRLVRGAPGAAGAPNAGAEGGALDRPRPAIPLAEAVDGVVTPVGESSFYRILTSAASVWPDADRFTREYREALVGPFPAAAPSLAPLRGIAAAQRGTVLYLDIETTGLGGSAPLFLVGLMYEEGERLVVDQLFARDYAEEAAVLRHLAALAPRFETLVTFNGIQFDVPYIRSRATVHRVDFAPPPAHVDLLLVARGYVGGRTPNHRLQTLETHLCGRKRVGDIPGAEIPGAYHEFVRTGNAKDVANIIHHNRLDLVTMIQLVTIFLTSQP